MTEMRYLFTNRFPFLINNGLNCYDKNFKFCTCIGLSNISNGFFGFFLISNRSKVITTKRSRIKNFAIGRHFDIYGRDQAHLLDVLSGFSTIPI